MSPSFIVILSSLSRVILSLPFIIAGHPFVIASEAKQSQTTPFSRIALPLCASQYQEKLAFAPLSIPC